MFCGTPIQQSGVEHSLDLGRRGRTTPGRGFPGGGCFILVFVFPLRGQGAGGEVLARNGVKPCSPANEVAGHLFNSNRRRTLYSVLVVQNKVKLGSAVAISANAVCTAPNTGRRLTPGPTNERQT